MPIIAKVLVALVALEHVYFLCVEMFMWTKPRTLRMFGMTEAQAQASKNLAANMGLYNGFLVAGLVWSLVAPSEFGRLLAVFFLSCVVIAGVFGGLTAARRILYAQFIPALVALIVVLVT